MKFKNLLVTLLIITLPIFFLTGCQNSNKEIEDLKEKGKAELNFLDMKLVSMLNDLNDLSLQNYEVATKQVPMSSEGETSSQSGSSSSQQQSSTGGGNRK